MKLIRQAIRLPKLLTITPASVKNRDKLIAKSQVFKAVSNEQSQGMVAANSTELRRLVKDAKAVCKPVLDAINAAAKAVRKIQSDYLEPVEAEQTRCERMLVEFDERETKRVEAETAAREAEIKRLSAPVEANGDVSMQELVAYQNEQALQAVMEAPLPEPAKPKGVAIKQVLRYEVTDIRALYAARPDLVRLEPNRAAIQDSCIPEMPVPGLKLWWEMDAQTRAA